MRPFLVPGMRALGLGVLGLVVATACRSSATEASATTAARAIDWQAWSPEVFERARAERRLVLLDLGAVWCHWCHVMEETTYADPEVIALVSANYVAVQVDQDARPDLAHRYEEYGWPATILFDADGRELAKLRGYIEPRRMAGLLAAFRDDPTPGPSALDASPATVGGAASALEPTLQEELETRWRSGYDREQGGFGNVHKFLDEDALEYALLLAAQGDADAGAMARETLERALVLVDPVWGGVYQYSDGGVWSNPHFEKIMALQASGLRLYSAAFALWDDPRHSRAARDVERYLATFLRDPSGAFYTSQDADLVQGEHAAGYFALDDAARRARGVPAIDRHRYARENGWAIDGLCALYAATGEPSALEAARAAARWALENRALPDGGFRRDEADREALYLGDTLALGRAFLSLYAITAERAWLEHAARAADFVASSFALAPERDGSAGFRTARPLDAGLPEGFAPQPQFDENVALARFANLLYRYGGDAAHRATAERAFGYVASPVVARERGIRTAGILLAARELASDPLHVTVVGPKSDASALALFRAALRAPPTYKRVEWLDAAEGALANPDVEYPPLAEPAAFLCADGACSRPITDPAELARRVRGS